MVAMPATHPDNSHPMVHPVGDIQVPLGVYPAAVRTFQTGVRGGSAVAIASPVPTRDGGHDAGHSIDAADRMVLGIDIDDFAIVVAPVGLWRTPRGGDVRSCLA